VTRGVTFRAWDERWASTRYRALIPQAELERVGIQQGRDVLVIGKHKWNWDTETAGYKRVVYDVCDSHWHDDWRDEVVGNCQRADAVTCNSRAMAAEIKEHTGRDAWVIPDPYESPQGEPRVHDKLLWFGFHWNAEALMPWLERLIGRDITLVTDVEHECELRPGMRAVPWSPANMRDQFQRAGLVILPTDYRPTAKSGNRAIESIRSGLYPICGPLPAYADLGVWIGDIAEGVDWALSRPDEAVQRIRAAQQYIATEYAPHVVARRWIDMLAHL